MLRQTRLCSSHFRDEEDKQWAWPLHCNHHRAGHEIEVISSIHLQTELLGVLNIAKLSTKSMYHHTTTNGSVSGSPFFFNRGHLQYIKNKFTFILDFVSGIMNEVEHLFRY